MSDESWSELRRAADLFVKGEAELADLKAAILGHEKASAPKPARSRKPAAAKEEKAA